ncbi:SRPBCC family protein [Streptomyces sp. NBC_00272]|uniref:SRPBCC family protein n=1 Tax=Streptomyces sp. NBC_00272 TaxID=2975698 RepID=UPI002E2AFE5D|nr:SRPBCC family protein [Streptomyces sp. NBC_00272]
MSTFDVRRTADAPPETVFGVFTDHRKYAALVTVIRSSVLEREGDPAPNGVGAVRRLHMPGVTVREQVTSYERPGRYSYRLVSGLPLRHFTATVTFTAVQHQRTEVVYSVTVEPKLSVLGPVVSKVAKKAISDFTDAAVARAETLTASTAAQDRPPGSG